jgi:TorA maturation chaperone TorD
MVLDDDANEGEMSKEIRRFISYHILSWIREWNTKIQFYSNTLSFKGIGNLILACTEDVFELFGQKSSASVSTDYTKN